MTKKLTPSLRFKEFIGGGNWTEKRLGEVAEFFSGGTPSVKIKEYYKGNIPFIRSGEIDKEVTQLYINEEALKNSSAKLVNKGDILYAMYGATSGQVSISKIKGAINQAILVIKLYNNYDKYYTVNYLKMNKERILNKYLQGGQGNLSGNIIKKVKFIHPKHIEQEKIGTFFKKLDSLIEKQDQKIENL
ncbi:MAG: restriction endonuclease subunit S, partial [Tissierellia bacterium]|nr:restriction endonuclease subunit S [Tissierellia bacterium]